MHTIVTRKKKELLKTNIQLKIENSLTRKYLRSTKENTYYLCIVHEVETVLYSMRFHGLDAILDRPGTFCLDLM